jgi:SAM-dependent methyltransferase
MAPVHDDPARYALEHAHYVEDLEFWRDAARRSGGPVLDLGCAVGRVAIPLAEDGHEVWALDASEAMLAELRSRAAAAGARVASRIHVVQADMCAFSLERRFALAIAAMNTLQTLLTGDRQLACLRTVREHLAPGGELVFDVALPDVGDITSTFGVVRHMAEHHDPQTGATLVHSAWYESYDPLDQTLRFTIQIDEIDAGGHVARYLRHHRVHLYLPTELAHLLARAGLEVVEILGDWDGTPVDPGSDRQIYRCRPA